MTHDIIKDLTAKRGREVFDLLAEFNRNAGWAGYFYEGVDATAVAQTGVYERTPKNGLHTTVWNRNHGTLNPAEFLRLVTTEAPYNATVIGYADDGKNQAIAVTRPPFYVHPATPHSTISWIATANPAASGYMQFSTQIPEGIPTTLRDGSIKVIMQNGREMNLVTFRGAIKAMEVERMNEIGAKLDPQIKEAIDKHFDTMTWEDLKKLIINGISFNEEMAKLYAQYRADTTDDQMPTLSEQLEARMAEDAAADRASDEEWNNADRLPNE